MAGSAAFETAGMTARDNPRLMATALSRFFFLLVHHVFYFSSINKLNLRHTKPQHTQIVL
ncbi:hypothetical protein AYY16_10615 [Morganella psychrotolerans]|nr:hypothetical protein AYY16_10615 [Morganella psychrotolerans]